MDKGHNSQILERISSVLNAEKHFDKNNLKRCVELIAAQLEDLLPFLVSAGDKPYGRNLIFKNSDVEVLLMDWRCEADCLAHDHGESIGWVHILRGTVLHTVYTVDAKGQPTVKQTSLEKSGSLIFAPKGLIHKMCNPSPVDRLTTLHFYTPPITGMEVFDRSHKMACTVSDDCGAWWPDPEQIVYLRKISNENT